MSSDTTPTPSRTEVQRVVIGEEEAGQRLDKALVRLLPQVPLTHCYRLLRKGEVRVNGKRAKGDQRLAVGDEVRLPPVRLEMPENPDSPRSAPRSLIERIEAAIVHQDERLLVVNKPSGVAVHGGSGVSFGVIEALRASRPDETLELAHRLDRDTSGCLIVARKRSSLRMLHALLRDDEGEGEGMDKRYLVLVKGKWEFGQITIDAPLDTESRTGGERTVRVSPRGKPAASRFRVVQFYGRLATLLEVRLLTGRTHQIRVHAAHAGHPVAGDPKYGDEAFNAQLRELGLTRLFLHAHSVGWPDVERRVDMSISAPLPVELKDALDAIETAGARKVVAAGPRAGQQVVGARVERAAAAPRVRESRSPPRAGRRKPRSTVGR